MPTNQQDIEFILRARDLSSRPFKDVAAAVDSVTTKLGQQVEAARTGEVSFSELNETIADLTRAQRALVEQMSDVQAYDKLTARLTTVEDRAQKATARYDAFNAKLQASATVTDRQAERLTNYRVKAENAAAAVTTMTERVAKQAVVLENAGFDTANLAEAENQLSTAAIRTGAALNTLSTAAAGYQRNLRAFKAEQSAQQTGAAQIAQAEAYQVEMRAAMEADKYLAQHNVALDEAAAAQLNYQRSYSIAEADAQLAQFRQLADEVIGASKGYETLANSTYRLTEVTSGAANAIRDILDPAGAARATLGGLETETRALGVAVAKLDGPVEDFVGTMRQLKAVQSEVTSSAELIDGFSRQEAVVSQARATYEAARQELIRLGEAMRAANEPSAELVSQARAAETTLARAATEMARETEALDRLDAGLKRAGIDSGMLAQEQERLATIARTATSATTALSAAQQRFGTASEESTKKLNLFGAEGRESLSLFQRWRGEILGIVAAYGGIIGVIELAKGSLESYVAVQAAENKLAIVVGTNEQAVGAAFNYVHEQADRLGVGFKDLIGAYSSFAIASKNAGLSLDATNFVFERLTEAMRVNHATSDQVSNAYLELEHMLSRNKVEMMDLNRIAAQMPGFEAAMARGLGLSVAQLFAEMKKGAIDSRIAVVAASEEIRRQYGEQLPKALHSLQAEEGRFATAWFFFEQKIADSGFADEFGKMLSQAATFFRSADGSAWAARIGGAFTAVTRILEFVIANINGVVTVIEAAFGVKAVRAVLALTTQLVTQRAAVAALALQSQEAAAATSLLAAGELRVGTATAAAVTAQTAQTLTMQRLAAMSAQYGGSMAANAAATTAAGTAAAGAGRAIGLLGGAMALLNPIMLGVTVAAAALSFGAMIKNQSDEGRAAIDTLEVKITGFVLRLRAIPEAIKTLSLDPLRRANKTQADMQSNVDQGLDPVTGKTAAEMANDAGAAAENISTAQYEANKQLEGLAQKISELGDEGQNKIHDLLADTAKWKTNQAGLTAEITKTRVEYKKMIDDSVAAARAGAGGSFSAATPGAVRSFNQTTEAASLQFAPWQREDPDKNAQKIADAEQVLINKLNEIDAKYNDTQKTNLADRLKAVKETYAGIEGELAKYEKLGGSTIGGKSIAQYKTEIAAIEKELQQEETIKFYTASVNDLLAERADRFKDINEAVAAGTMTTAEGYKATEEANAALTDKIRDLANQAIVFARALGGAAPSPALQKFIADMGRTLGKESGPASVASAQYTAQDTSGLGAVQAEVTSRNESVKATNDLQEAGLISHAEAQASIANAYSTTTAKIKEMAAALEAVITAQHDLGQISDEAFTTMDAKIKLIVADAKYINPIVAELNKTINDDLVKDATAGFEGVSKAIAGVVTRTETWKEALGSLEQTIGSFFADLLKDLAEVILKQELMSALGIGKTGGSGEGGAGGAGGIGGWLGGLLGLTGDSGAIDTSAPGVVGDSTALLNSSISDAGLGSAAADTGAAASSGGFFSSIADFFSFLHAGGPATSNTMRRQLPISVFAGAPRLHSGAQALGLNSDEIPAILQQGEDVLGKNDKNNLINRARSGQLGGSGPSNVAIRSVLLMDPDLVPAAMAGPAGEKAVLTHIGNNQTTVRQMVGK